MSLGYLIGLYRRGNSLREGVASSRDSKPDRYKLPRSLVKSFEYTVMVLIYTSRAITLADHYCNRAERYSRAKKKESRYRSRLEAIRDDIDKAGSAAVLSMEKAENDLLLMARTNYNHGMIRYDDVGPEYILATVMANVIERPLVGCDAVDGLYRTFHNTVVRTSITAEKYSLTLP